LIRPDRFNDYSGEMEESVLLLPDIPAPVSMILRVEVASLAPSLDSIFAACSSVPTPRCLDVPTKELLLLESELLHDPIIPDGDWDDLCSYDPVRASKWIMLANLLEKQSARTILKLPPDVEDDYGNQFYLRDLLDDSEGTEWYEEEIWWPTIPKSWPIGATALRSLCAKTSGDSSFHLNLSRRFASPACLLLVAAELQGATQLNLSGLMHATTEQKGHNRIWEPRGMNAILKALPASAITTLDLSDVNLCGVTPDADHGGATMERKYTTECLETLVQAIFGTSLSEPQEPVSAFDCTVKFQPVGAADQSGARILQQIPVHAAVEQVILAWCVMTGTRASDVSFWHGLRELKVDVDSSNYTPNVQTFYSLRLPKQVVIEYASRNQTVDLPLRTIR
jgi:hypothetical protein